MTHKYEEGVQYTITPIDQRKHRHKQLRFKDIIFEQGVDVEGKEIWVAQTPDGVAQIKRHTNDRMLKDLPHVYRIKIFVHHREYMIVDVPSWLGDAKEKAKLLLCDLHDMQHPTAKRACRYPYESR